MLLGILIIFLISETQLESSEHKQLESSEHKYTIGINPLSFWFNTWGYSPSEPSGKF